MSLSFGAELRLRRLAAGVSLTAFAKKIHYSKSFLSKVENGTKQPSSTLARLCDAALSADGALADLAAGRSSGAAGPSFDDPADLIEWTIRSEPIGPAIQSLGALPRSLSTSLPDEAFGLLRSRFDDLRRLTQMLSPASMLPTLMSEVRTLRLAAASTSAGQRAPLWLLAGRYAELTGWMTQEAGDDEGALWWTGFAVKMALASGDQEMSAYALVRQADITMYRGNAADTIRLARLAQEAGSAPRIRGIAAQREAQGFAMAGDLNYCRRALDRAASWLDHADDLATGPQLGTSTVPDPVGMAAGWCLHDLGRPDEAAEKLAVQLDMIPQWATRSRARLGARYALALLVAGDMDTGCAALGRALDDCDGLGSATVLSDLRLASKELHRHPKHRAAKATMPRLVDALAA